MFDVFLNVLVLLDVIAIKSVFTLLTIAYCWITSFSCFVAFTVQILAFAILTYAAKDPRVLLEDLQLIFYAIFTAKATDAHLLGIVKAWAKGLKAIAHTFAVVSQEFART